jgi:hypothetical protein
VAAADSLREDFEARRRELVRSLVVVGSAAAFMEVLARPVIQFCRQYPNIKLSLQGYAGTWIVESASVAHLSPGQCCRHVPAAGGRGFYSSS